MDGSFLSPKEQQCYSALFSTLDTESAGRIKTVEVFEFFLRSGLNPEVLQQVNYYSVKQPEYYLYYLVVCIVSSLCSSL